MRSNGEIVSLSGSANAAWGGITGTLSSQTDLQNALNAKSDTSHNHNGVYQPLATVLTNTTASFTTAQESKLAGIASGATANSADATLLARANHTGTQAASTISDFSEAVDDRVAALLQAGSNITLTYNDGANTLTVAAAGGSGNNGTATVDFGTKSSDTSVVVTGQTGILSNSLARAFISGATTADHSEDEHIVEDIRLTCGSIVAGTGFTIYAQCMTGTANGQFTVNWSWA